MLRPLCLALALAFTAASAHAADDISKVNGAIRVEAGQEAGDVDTVNGAIRIGENARVAKVSTVNGAIDIESGVTLEAVETVNGRIAIGARVQVAGDAETVNGALTLREGSDLSGKASTVNGLIRLESARVGGGIETVNGDIEIGEGSRVERGILVEKPSGWSFGKPKLPRVVIGPNAVVEGTLEFRREVELFVSETARVGEIKGATAKRFSGTSP